MSFRVLAMTTDGLGMVEQEVEEKAMEGTTTSIVGGKRRVRHRLARDQDGMEWITKTTAIPITPTVFRGCRERDTGRGGAGGSYCWLEVADHDGGWERRERLEFREGSAPNEVWEREGMRMRRKSMHRGRVEEEGTERPWKMDDE
jgi:hypothetical protein